MTMVGPGIRFKLVDDDVDDEDGDEGGKDDADDA